MKLGSAASGGKQNPALIVVLIVIILAAVFFVGRNFIGGGGTAEMPEPGTVPTPGLPVPPTGLPGPGAPPPPPGAPGAPEGTQPPAQPGAPEPQQQGAPPAPAAPGPGSARPAPAAPTAAAPAAAPSPAAARAPAPEVPLEPIKVFRNVTVQIPKGWGVDIAAASTAAVFTNGKANFEVHAPDPRAGTAKEIADSALRTLGGSVTAESTERISGYEAHEYTVSKAGTITRIVGVDAPTRVVLVAYARSGSFADYRPVFDRIQSNIRFSAQ